MPPTHPFEKLLLADWPRDRWGDVGLLVAVSGGADSVALLRALLAAADGKGRIAVGHFNHRLRGAESDEDQQFVTALAAQWGLPVEVGYADVAPDREGGEGADGREAAARQQRYRFLNATAQRLGVRYLVTAHTADDQAETVLHRLLRGTGVAGLAGIPRVRLLSEAVTLVRPLLSRRRSEVLDYLATLGQSFRVDSSNRSLDYTRNRLRHDLIPRLERDYNPRVVEAVVRLGRLADETQEAIDVFVDQLAQRCVEYQAPVAADDSAAGVAWPSARIDCRALAGQPRHLVRELLLHVWRALELPEQSMGYAEWERLADLCLAAEAPGPDEMAPGSLTLPGNVGAARGGHQVTLQRR